MSGAPSVFGAFIILFGALALIAFAGDESVHINGVGQSITPPATRVASKQPPNSDAYKALFDWVTVNGGDVSAVTVADCEGMGGCLVAKRPLAPGEPVFRLPRDVAMTMTTAARSAVGPVLRDLVAKGKITGLDSEAILLLHLHFEAHFNPSSFWRPYLDALPDEAPLMSLTFSEAQVASISLVPGHHSKLARSQSEANLLVDFLMDVMAAYPSVFGQQQEDWRDLAVWSYATLSTRMYGPRFAGDSVALIPVADLCNHFPDAAVLNHSLSASNALLSYVHHVKRSVFPGDPIVTSYDSPSARLCNSDLLITYGFTSPHAAAQCEVITIHANVSEASLSLVRKLALADVGIPPNLSHVSFWVNATDVFPIKLLQYARIMQMSHEDAKFYDLVKVGKPLSPQNEMLAVQMIRQVCLTLLNDYRNKRTEALKSGTISIDDGSLKPVWVAHATYVKAISQLLDAVEQHWKSFVSVPGLDVDDLIQQQLFVE